MIELARHLEILLLSNDCVTVPDFGGFVAHYVPARVDEADGMFLPPMRTIGFNPQLKMNDSLLAQSYVEAYDISYPEALRRIEQDVEEIRKKVLHEGACLLDGIGTLTSNDEGNYSFEPYEAGLLTPSLYGLTSYEFSTLKGASATPPKPAETVQTKTTEETVVKDEEEEEDISKKPLIELMDDEDDTDSAIHIKMSWIRNAVAVAAAIVLFFLMSSPVANSNLESQTMSALKQTFFQKMMPKDTNMTPATPVIAPKETDSKVEAKVDSQKTVPAVKPAPAPKQETAKTDNSNPYCLVLASQVKRSNAELFANKLKERGFKDTEINVHNGVVRVVYGHFKSESDAYKELSKLHFEEDFEEAWVYKRKTEG